MPAMPERRGKLEVLRPDDGGTSLSVIDAEGAAVSLTTTINLHFGAKLLVPARGSS